MGALLANIHWVIILYTAATLYMGHEEFEENILMQRSQIPALRNTIKRKERQRDELKKYVKDLEDARGRIQLVTEEIKQLQKQLPNDISDTENLELIKNLAENLNIKNVFLSPGPQDNKGFYFTKRYQFKGIGTYLQFLIFFEKIAENERLLNVVSLDLNRADEKQRGRFQLINCTANILAYRYNNDYKEDDGINELDKKFKGQKKQ